MIPTPSAAASGQHLLQRLAAEHVEDDLHGGDVRPDDRLERLVDGLDGHPVGGDAALVDEHVEGVVGGLAAVHLRRRAVQLHQVEGVDVEVLARAVGPGAEPRERVGVGDVRVGAAAHLRRDGQAVVRAAGGQERADELLGAAVAVDVGGVQERHAGVDGGSEWRARDWPPHRDERRAALHDRP